jgi:hypothetical protein
VSAQRLDEHQLGQLGEHRLPAGATMSGRLHRGIEQTGHPLPARG